MKTSCLIILLIGTLTACGKSDSSHLTGNCTLPKYIANPEGKELTPKEFLTGKNGRYEATRIDYFLTAQDMINDRQYTAFLSNELQDPGTGTLTLKCQDGYPQTTVSVEMAAPYVIDRSSGKLSSAKLESFTIQESKITAHNSKSFEGQTLQNYLDQLKMVLMGEGNAKIYQRSATEFLMITELKRELMDVTTLYSAVTYTLISD